MKTKLRQKKLLTFLRHRSYCKTNALHRRNTARQGLLVLLALALEKIRNEPVHFRNSKNERRFLKSF